MALKLNNATEALTAALTNASLMSFGIWARPASTTSDPESFAGLIGNADVSILRSTNAIGLKASWGGGFTPYVVTNGSWYYLAFFKNVTTWTVSVYDDVATESRHDVVAAQYRANTLTGFSIGDFFGPHVAANVNIEYLHMRAWTSLLTTAQMNTEKNSATAVLTPVLACSFNTTLTAETGTSPTVTAGTGHTFTANVPTSVGSAPSGAALLLASQFNQG